MINTMLTFENKERVSSEERQNEDVYELSARPGGLLHVCNDICLHRPSLLPNSWPTYATKC